MTLALQSPDRVEMSPVWWQLHLSIPSRTVLSDGHTHRKNLTGKLLFLVWTPSLCWASNQSPEGALCFSGHFRGEQSKSKEQSSQQQGSQRTEKMWMKCQRITAAVREHKQAFGSRSFYFHRASCTAYCLRSEGLTYKSFFAKFISISFKDKPEKIDWELQTARKMGIWGSSCRNYWVHGLISTGSNALSFFPKLFFCQISSLK